ncbi:MAG: hypothetical protein KF905_06135 [Flavobacteriales bacterium]|nr:hypothetical protein [Flavobacteriales bacterium]
MKPIRILTGLLIAPACLLAHDLFVSVYDHYIPTTRHDMLAFGVSMYITGWALVTLFPIAAWLGELWWNDRKRYLLTALLLLGLTIFFAPNWGLHPHRSLQFLAFCWLTIPARMLTDRIGTNARS